VPYQGKTLVALWMETNRAPFVIKNQSGRLPHREVPWRDGTETRTAHRSDLLKILVPIQKLPEFELLGQKVVLREDVEKRELRLKFILTLKLYVTTFTDEVAMNPFHRCNAEIKWNKQPHSPMLERITLKQPYRFLSGESDSLTIESTGSEVLIGGPGKLNLEARLSIPETPKPMPKSLKVIVSLDIVKSQRIVTVECEVKRKSHNSDQPQIGVWE